MVQVGNGQKQAIGRINKREVALFGGVLIALLIAVAGAVLLIPRLQMTYSLKQFLPPNHPLLKADDETKRRFALNESQPILVTLELPADKGDWLKVDRLNKLDSITSKFVGREHILQAMSLGTLSLASQGRDDLAVGKLSEIKDAKARRARVAYDRFLTPNIISKDLRRTMVVISAEEAASFQFLEGVMNEVRADLKKAFPEAQVLVGGVPAIQTRLTSMVRSELVQFMSMALVASCLTLLLVFSSVWSAIVPFFAIIIANIFVLAFMAWAGISMTVLAVTIPILVSIAVLSLCAHTMLRFVEEAHRSTGVPRFKTMTVKGSLVLETLAALFSTNLLTSVITCFGFATLLVTQVPVIREFGLTVAVSVLISWISTTAILAPMLAALPVPVARKWVLAEANWVRLVFVYRRGIILSVSIFCIAMALIGQHLHWSARLFDDLPEKEEARIATENIDRSLGGTIPFEILITQTGTEPWNEPAALTNLDILLSKLRKRHEVGSAIGLTEVLRQALGNPQAKVPPTRAAVAQAWFLLTMAEQNPMKQFLTDDGLTARIGLRVRDLPADDVAAAMAAMVRDARQIFPKAQVSTGGMATTVHVLNNELSRHLLEGFFHALGVITVLLFLVFRSWRWTLTAVLPNLVPATVLIGVLALTKTPIKPGVALVFSIALGIAFINTVYLLFRLKDLMKETGRQPHQLIEWTLSLEGNPCLVSSVCVLAGFGIFLASEFGINRTFGTYMLISLFFGLVGDLVFLPALIRQFPSILGSTPKDPGGNLSVEDKETDLMKKTSELPRAAASVALIVSSFIASQTFAAPDANTILKNVGQRMYSKDDSVKIKMKVVEANGSSKDRELEIKRKGGDKQQVLVRLQSPADVSGIGFLSVWSGSKEDQWIYMPSQKKARRVVSGNKAAKFLDTEFAMEDFSANTYAHFTNKVIKEERAPSASVAVIESKARDKGTTYSRILTWVDTTNYQVQKGEYYDANGKLLKTMVFRDYKQFGNTWRAQTMEVRNMQNNRSTVLKIASMKVNSGLADRDFTQSALEDYD